MSYKNTQRWRSKAKLWLVRYSGGKCQSCGYNQCHGALAWHHLHNKAEGISKLINKCAAWDKIIEEADKCVMVCQNCHCEIHAGMRPCPQVDLEKRALTLATILAERPVPKIRQVTSCAVCGAAINATKRFCSMRCVHKSQEKTTWPDNLASLVQASSCRAIARSLGVSDKAVVKRLRNHAGIA